MRDTNKLQKQGEIKTIHYSIAQRDLFPALIFILLFSAIFLLLFGMTLAQDEKIPNDPYFKWQVSYHNDGGDMELKRYSISKSTLNINTSRDIHHNITRAWNITTGSKAVVVAVIDDGFFYEHEDLKGNIWTNPGESGIGDDGRLKQANGIDDDNNGYVDDVMGWDFYFDDPDPDAYIFDGRDVDKIAIYWHSISALGIIGARGNNGTGVAGINWDVSMMLLKTCAQGNTTIKRAENTARAIRYAVDNGARLINWSGGIGKSDSISMRHLKEAIDYAEEKGILLILAAGNSLKNIDLEENYIYPACYPNENIISVGEVDFDGTLYTVPEGSKFIGGSNYGVKNVDIAALAQNYTTSLYNNVSIYGIGSGTSNAAPVVSGVAALIFSIRPDLTGPEVKQIILESCKRLPDLEGKVASGGMVDALAALKLALSRKK